MGYALVLKEIQWMLWCARVMEHSLFSFLKKARWKAGERNQKVVGQVVESELRAYAGVGNEPAAETLGVAGRQGDVVPGMHRYETMYMDCLDVKTAFRCRATDNGITQLEMHASSREDDSGDHERDDGCHWIGVF